MRNQMESMQKRIEALEVENAQLQPATVDERLASLEETVERKAAAWTDMIKVKGSLDMAYIGQDNSYFVSNSSYWLETVARIGVDIKINEYFSGEVLFTGENAAGDPVDYTGSANPAWNFEVELANITYSNILDMPLSVTAGRQNLEYGDGFLIYDGFTDQRAVWMAVIRSFYAVKGVYEWGPFQLDGFIAMPDSRYQSFETYLSDFTGRTGRRYLYGGNLHLEEERFGTWDFGVFYKDDHSPLESDTLAISQRGSYTFDIWPEIAALPKITLEGEIVEEVGRTKVQNYTFMLGNPRVNRMSIGGHGDIILSFDDVALEPYFKYSYVHLPGDDPRTSQNETFDPMFYGSSDWGKWYLGDINSGNLYNYNQRTMWFELGFYPTETTMLRVQQFYTRLDREVTPTARKEWSQETNVIFDWYPNDYFYCGALWGYAFPLKSARALAGDKKRTSEFVLWAGIAF